MTFTRQDIENVCMEIEYGSELTFDEEYKTIRVQVYGFEQYFIRMFNFQDYWEDATLTCFVTINPFREEITEIYFFWDYPQKELLIKILHNSEGKMLLNELIKCDKKNLLSQFIKEIKSNFE